MKSSITTSTNFNSITIQSNANLIDAEFYSEKQTSASLDLYDKHDDEPDFDCEFLQGISYNEENENTIDAEADEDFADLYNDNQWDVDIYDPYSESTYF
ncbi:hypothetical protein GCM10022422_09450 [Flavobacterium ginsengisoli]|uniref:Uncharacterized protein n=1 Tax=Flavobacterium ginsengisoli TaxID=871694 RepID=A0ABP7F396_9FLAO|nr:hypothetical protein [Flavobacterium ginsengisoli]